MSLRPLALAVLLCAVAFGGCATYTNEEITRFRQLGLGPELVVKLERWRPLDPEDLIELRRARVSDELVLRHLSRVGIDYVVTRSDVVRLRRAGVSARVRDALLLESDRFALRRTFRPDYDGGYDNDPWLWPGFYGGLSIGYSTSIGRGSHHCNHH